MGKFESYPEANALGDNDITLYNKNTVTHKITFSRLVNLIKNKIAQTGLVTSISTGAGLVGDTITSSGTIKCKLKSETVSSLSSANPTITANRQYAVGLDREGYLSVNVPWTENSTYSSGTAIDITNETINVILDNTYSSSSTVKAASAKAVKDAYDNSMRKDGNNADTHVHFSNALTVGTTRKLNSTIGSNSVCFGYGNIASKNNSFASGAYTEALEFASHSEGYGTDQPNYINSQYNSYNDDATANIAATAYGSHAEGYTTYDEQSGITGIIQANGIGSHAEGCAESGQGDGVIIAYGKGSHAEGYADSAVIGADCANIAYGNGSHVEGIDTYAGGVGSHAEGIMCTANGESSHAEGQASIARGYASHAEGQFTTAGGSFSHAEGSCGTASGVGSHIEGGVLKGSPRNLGLYQSQNNNTELVKTTDTSFTLGKTYYLTPHVITPAVNANPKQNNWLELQSVNVYIYSQDLTVDSSKTYYDCDVIFGDSNKPSASGYFTHSEGNYTVASGHYSHSEGQGTTASGNRSHAEGQNTIASGNNSHSEGQYTTASGICSHTEGNYAIASGDYSHTEGRYTAASSNCSHAEGYHTTASNTNAHAEGYQTISSGYCSHAEGESSRAIGYASHAEGQLTTADGVCAHSEGVGTTASGNYSHAEGFYTQATYQGAHVGGARAISTQKYQFLQGGDAYKFGVNTYGRGIFGVSPNAASYTSSDIEEGETSITLDGTNSVSASVENSVSVLINLSNYAMYMLYWTTYSGTDDTTMSSGIHLISTSAATNNPYIQNILSNTIIDSVGANSVTLLSNNKYMFHLIRII